MCFWYCVPHHPPSGLGVRAHDHLFFLSSLCMFALEMNKDHSVVFEIAPKYCISDSLVDYEGYSISSKGFLPTVVDITVI